jgi:NAD+ synthase
VIAEFLRLDPVAETERIASVLRSQVRDELRRKGLVIGLSGGIDSSTTAALAVRALGAENVFGLLMPELDSSGDSIMLGQLVAATFGIRAVVEDITPTLQAVGCYERRDEAIRSVLPEYGAGWRSKLVVAAPDSRLNISSLIVQSPGGEQRKVRLTAGAYSQIVAATNFKQRVRKMFEYYHADRLQYAVAGTPNRLEFDQAFFVKNGDGAADVKPIAHLYKTQVYQLAAHLGVPEEILRRPPTTDTFSMPQSQEEFYFAAPLEMLDVCLYGLNNGWSPADVAARSGLTVAQAEQTYEAIEHKRRATRYLQTPALTIEDVRSTPSTVRCPT